MQPDFGNWIRLRIIAVFSAVAAGALLAAALMASAVAVGLLLAAGLAAAAMGAFLGYLYYQFAVWGGGMQRVLWEQTGAALDWGGVGEALDVGTGNGALAILLAQKFPGAKVVGIDPWGFGWEYSRKRCEENAGLSGVGDRVRFLQASAAALPFPDESFDAVVSHFVFHEVGGVDPLAAIDEALRVLRPGGAFAFQDMFFEPRFYGATPALTARLRALNVAAVELVDYRKQTPVPWLMNGRRVLGCRGIVRGRK